MPDKCPRCGAIDCDSYNVRGNEFSGGPFLVETEDCLRRQNAALREALRDVESDARIAYDELRDGQYDNAESYIWRVVETLERHAAEVPDDE